MRDATGLILQMRKLRPSEGSHSQVAALRALEGHAGQGLASTVRACNWMGSLGFGQERAGIMLLVGGESLQGSETSEKEIQLQHLLEDPFEEVESPLGA